MNVTRSAPLAAHFFVLRRSARNGTSASPRRIVKKAIPATMPMWSPAMTRMWASPASRKAWASTSGMAWVSPAIITGETHAIPEVDAQAFRDAGLAHILVIAGLHMGMVAGIAFFTIRLGLALVPFLALRLNTKKWAASGALLVTFIYLLLSGITVSSRRSFVM